MNSIDDLSLSSESSIASLFAASFNGIFMSFFFFFGNGCDYINVFVFDGEREDNRMGVDRAEALEPHVRSESLCQSNELEQMRKKLEAWKLVLGNLLMQSKTATDDIKNQTEQLSVGIRSLLVAGKALSEANTLLAGKRGHVHLRNLQKMLRMRQQYMIAQVSALYPVKGSLGQSPGENLHSSPDGSKSGDESGSSATSSKTNNPGMSSLTILGLQLTVPPLKKMSFFSDKKEAHKSATALGYVAHAVLLVASYLDVPLRYPLRLGGSHSYIFNHAPSFEPTSTDLASNSIVLTNTKATEFPLFIEGQDTTKAAYAIFLLNKDIEQLLNFVGIQSLGSRHVLTNLKELFRTIQSREFIDS
ncbi:UV radiation resistance protein/autophagy-related protein 14 [Cinnamomum micranthum f. kanehirae]|uniref:UV radiation resistance protein/autophagy-related protein 14 n=1 Tax=Cinnamomum micranthum f. kanehirae TaxID=337451 RepID=A0A443NMJ4_9MAGN|nr:UV radiation resistance protein/autophagy-related protein 14 [Cinnamomum micranthum f. kanehirae]